jgi:hypothetical protein
MAPGQADSGLAEPAGVERRRRLDRRRSLDRSSPDDELREAQEFLTDRQIGSIV